ncbi:MAG: sugar isomerase [Clostridia bacterium]|nr:sugar isomerase [Clostridia bacterium]
MYDYRKITVGIAPTRRDFFPSPVNARANKGPIMARLRELLEQMGDVEIVDIDSINEEGLLVETSDVPAVVRLFRERGVDALILPHTNFGQEEPIGKLAKALGVPTLLWGPRDERPPADAPNRQADIQCGLFASSRALQRYGVPFTYIENCHLDAPVLAEELDRFIRAASVVKAFRSLRVLQLSTRPRQFLSVKVNESELMEKFGIEVIPVESAEIIRQVKQVLENDPARIDQLLEEWRQTFRFEQMKDEAIRNMAALELAIVDLATKYECGVVSGECWQLFQANFGIRPCFVWGDLGDRGLPTACENDIHGAISQALMLAATRGRTMPFLADLTIRHPDNDNAELLWHCGPFPSSLAKEGADKAIIGCHGAWEIKGGDITLCRFDAANGQYMLFADECRGTDGPPTDGNYVWVETDDWVRWEKKLIYGPYIHHIIGAHGHYRGVFEEACRYMDVTHDHP